MPLMSFAQFSSFRKDVVLLPVISVQLPTFEPASLFDDLSGRVTITITTMATANATIAAVTQISPHGVCFWLTMDLPGFFAGGRAPGGCVRTGRLAVLPLPATGFFDVEA